MTSVVDTSVKFFLDTMAGAPVLTSEAGSLIALLDACLINGFDTKTVTSLVVSGGVATATFSGLHSAEKDTVILVAGATGAYTALNGEQKVTQKVPGSVSFATAAADGTAAGTITFKMAPAGWNKVFSASNIAVYKSSDPMSHGHFLRVDDSGVDSGSPSHCLVQAYETMTDINTGTGLFPTPLQTAEGGSRGAYWAKKYSAGINTRPIPWSVFADSRIFYFAPSAYTAENPAYQSFVQANISGFGDLKPFRPGGDAYATALAGRTSASNAQSYPDHGSFNVGQGGYGNLWVPREHTGIGQAVRGVAYVPGAGGIPSGMWGAGAGPFPSPVDGSLVYTKQYWRKWLIDQEIDYALRAEIPGLYFILQNRVYPNLVRGTRVPGSGMAAGRTLYCHMVGTETSDPVNNPSTTGISLIDVTGPWR